MTGLTSIITRDAGGFLLGDVLVSVNDETALLSSPPTEAASIVEEDVAANNSLLPLPLVRVTSTEEAPPGRFQSSSLLLSFFASAALEALHFFFVFLDELLVCGVDIVF